jgi:16S rRNA (guanine1207-N2)-methyltransferase
VPRPPSAPHYFNEDPSAPSRPRPIRLRLPDIDVELTADSGVFAATQLDPGTRLLLREAPPPPASGRVLDLGCGYGAIAVALALRAPGAEVVAVDINSRALELCAANARAAGVRIRSVRPEEVDGAETYDAIYSNPPIRIGKAALHDLLERWLIRLVPGGHAYLVVLRHLGADSLAEWLRGKAYGVTRLGSKRGYRLLDVQAPGPDPHHP